MRLRAFIVYPKDKPEWGKTINAPGAGKAKSDLLLKLRDAGWLYNFTDMRSRLLGEPYTSDDFKRCAEYRGLPFVKCGTKVIFEDKWEGIVQGHSSSARFNILFTSGPNKGVTLSCHPNHGLAYLEDDQNINGVRRFINRMVEWMKRTGDETIDFEKFKKEIFHYTESFKFNKVVSSFMIFYNENKKKNLTEECKEELIQLLSLYMPNFELKFHTGKTN